MMNTAINMRLREHSRLLWQSTIRLERCWVQRRNLVNISVHDSVDRDTSTEIRRQGYVDKDTSTRIRRQGYVDRDTEVRSYLSFILHFVFSRFVSVRLVKLRSQRLEAGIEARSVTSPLHRCRALSFRPR